MVLVSATDNTAGLYGFRVCIESVGRYLIGVHIILGPFYERGVIILVL